MRVAAATLWLLAAVVAQASDRLDLALPTENDALFRGDGPAFYQYIERDYNGAKSTPWEGGRYGFVRDPQGTAAGIFYTRFHEGVDIKPLHRDENGEPTDEIRAIAPGKVVYVNDAPGRSNYGRYIVIEHRFDGCPYYSLYGHLSRALVAAGANVGRGERIAIMGWTGVGINRERAHVHLELNLLWSDKFDDWYNHFIRSEPNYHGIYNGLNLQGLDIARLYLASRDDPSLTIPQFLAREETFYRVALPKSSHLQIAKRYPWLVKSTSGNAWEVSFSRAGLPLKIEATNAGVAQPQLTFVKQTPIDARYYVRGELAGRGAEARFTDYGARLMQLLYWPN